MSNVKRVTWDKLPTEVIVLVNEFLMDIAPDLPSEGLEVSLHIAHDQCLGVAVYEKPFVGAAVYVIDWNSMSERGILYAINRYVLHKRNYALARDPETGHSPFVFEADETWVYSPEDDDEGQQALRANNVVIPNKYL